LGLRTESPTSRAKSGGPIRLEHPTCWPLIPRISRVRSRICIDVVAPVMPDCACHFAFPLVRRLGFTLRSHVSTCSRWRHAGVRELLFQEGPSVLPKCPDTAPAIPTEARHGLCGCSHARARSMRAGDGLGARNGLSTGPRQDGRRGSPVPPASERRVHRRAFRWNQGRT
jgi:hypothetical protein